MRTGVTAACVALMLTISPAAFAAKQKTVDVDGAIRHGGKVSAKLVLERETGSDGVKRFVPHKLRGVKATGIPYECRLDGSTGSIDQDFGSFRLKFVDGYEFGKVIELGPDSSASIQGFVEPDGKKVKGSVGYRFLKPEPDGASGECSTRAIGGGAGKFILE
jgi:hypothetical protein